VRRTGGPNVVAEVVSIAPGDDRDLAAWERALHPVEPVDVPMEAMAANAGWTIGAGVIARGLLALLAALGTAAFRIFSA
jgi:hypothetical protein